MYNLQEMWIITEYFAAAGILKHQVNHLVCLHYLQNSQFVKTSNIITLHTKDNI